MSPALRVRELSKSYVSGAPVLAGLDLEVPEGAIVVLLGSSGCGKTTLLRLVAGFERADAGSVEVAGQLVEGPGRHVPAERRRVAVVPQDGALFPHLSVAGNVAFGLPRAQRRGPRVDQVLELVDLAGLGRRMPHELSGGQQQRVALARALAPGPSLVLLDEPFNALDAALRSAVRAEVRECLRAAGASAVLVTHDQQEALSTADVVAVVRGGRVVQAAEPPELYTRPGDLGIATFVGEAVVLPGTAAGATVDCALGRLPLVTALSGPVQVMVRPEQIDLVETAGALPAVVVDREFYGHDALLQLRLADGTPVTARTPGWPYPPPGTSVGLRCTGPVVAFAGS